MEDLAQYHQSGQACPPRWRWACLGGAVLFDEDPLDAADGVLGQGLRGEPVRELVHLVGQAALGSVDVGLDLLWRSLRGAAGSPLALAGFALAVLADAAGLALAGLAGAACTGSAGGASAGVVESVTGQPYPGRAVRVSPGSAAGGATHPPEVPYCEQFAGAKPCSSVVRHGPLPVTHLSRRPVGPSSRSTAVLALAACSSMTRRRRSSKVATTVAPITSIAANIGGDRVDIEGIVPEGTNSHTFEPAPQVAELLSTADVVLINGLQLEEPTKDLAESNMKDDAVLVELGDEVLPEEDYIFDFSFPEEDGKPNPHLWTDPTYAVEYAEVIAETFSEQDPDNADYYEKNLDAFTEKANALARRTTRRPGVGAGGQPQAGHLPRRVRLLRRDVSGGMSWVPSSRRTSRTRRPQRSRCSSTRSKARASPTIFGSEVFPSAVLEEIGKRHRRPVRGHPARRRPAR